MKKYTHIFISALLLIASNVLAAPPVSTYHNATGDEHQTAANNLVAQGFRPTFIGVHGTKNDPRYSAVWLQKTGPAWSAFHGRALSSYPTLVADAKKNGLYPAWLSVVSDGTGTGEAVIAGSFEGGAETIAKIDLISGKADDILTIEYWVQHARNNSLIPIDIALYGTENAPKWAIILKPNPKKIKWTVALWDNATDNQKRFSPTVKQWARPIFYSRSSFDRYVSIYVDDVVGPWEARGPLDWQSYQNLATEKVKQGFIPISVQGGGSGASTTWTVVFVKNEIPVERQFTAQGSGSDYFKPVDDLMKKYMSDYGVRGASVAVVKNGKLVYAKGLTWAEPGYPVTTPTSLFRLASTSKPITSTAIHQLEQKWQLTPGTFVQSVLNIKTPDGGTPPDERLADIKVDHLLYHRGGWNRSIVYDLPGDAATAASYQNTLPISKSKWISEKFKQNLQFDPDTKNVYSNFGYLLLGRILEAKYPRKTYEEIVKENIFTPLGITRAAISPVTFEEALPQQVRFHENYLGIGATVMNNTGDWVPLPYGVENYRNFDSFGGWMMASVDYAKFLAIFELGDKNPILNKAMTDRMWTVTHGDNQARGWARVNVGNGVWAVEHGGALPGVGTVISRRSDGIAFVIFTNSGLEGSIIGDMHNALASLPAASWPDASVDFFPTYGLPVNPNSTIRIRAK